MVKAADQQYGGLAYGTLSILLSVYVHKSQREEALLEGFEELKHAFPRLKTLVDVRLDTTVGVCASFQQLENLIAEVFVSIIMFAREATEYYSSQARRLKDTLLPGKTKAKTLANVRKQLSEVHKECEVLMLVQITSLQKSLSEMSVELRATHDGVVRTESHVMHHKNSEDMSYLSALRRLLDAKETSDSTDVVLYRDRLKIAFSGLRSKYAHPKGMSMELFKGDADFASWWDSLKSCMFIAGGTNWQQDSSSGPFSWLSMGAVLTIQELQQNRKNVAFFFAYPTWSVRSNSRKRSSPRDMMASLLYQIAKMDHDLLRSKLHEIETTMLSALWNEEDNEPLMESIHNLLVDVFSAFAPEDEITIVVDRLDKCNWNNDNDRRPWSRLKRMVECLVRVVAESRCQVKILLTVDTSCSQEIDRVGLVLGRRENQLLLLKPEWCQEIEEGRSDE